MDGVHELLSDLIMFKIRLSLGFRRARLSRLLTMTVNLLVFVFLLYFEVHAECL